MNIDKVLQVKLEEYYKLESDKPKKEFNLMKSKVFYL